jgi:hypothetical protein
VWQLVLRRAQTQFPFYVVEGCELTFTPDVVAASSVQYAAASHFLRHTEFGLDRRPELADRKGMNEEWAMDM